MQSAELPGRFKAGEGCGEGGQSPDDVLVKQYADFEARCHASRSLEKMSKR